MTAELDVLERTPPQDVQAERAVLGSVLLAPRCMTDLDLRAADFYLPAHSTIWDLLARMADDGQPIDPMTVGAALMERGLLGKVGGGPYLHTLVSSVATAANAGHYAGIVADRARRRRVIEAGTRCVQLGYSTSGEGADWIVDAARQEMDRACTARTTGAVMGDADELVADGLERWAGEPDRVLPTGWPDIDDMLNGGLRPGHMTIVAARPGVGKSTVSVELTQAVARRGCRVMVFSLEMSRAEYLDRLVANVAAVPVGNLIASQLSDVDWTRVAEWHPRVASWPWSVDDRPGLSVRQIRDRARVEAGRGLRLIVVDQISLIRPADGRASREQQVAAVSQGLRSIAQELGVSIVVLSQVNRNPEGRLEKRPVLSDLRESGSLEADADEVIFLFREEETGRIEFNVAKNRHGSSRRVDMYWYGDLCRVKAMTRGTL